MHNGTRQLWKVSRAASAFSIPLACLFFCPIKGNTQTSGAAFLNVTPSVRAYGLGLANVTSALGAEAIGANPANLGVLSRRFDVFTSYASIMDSTHYEHLAAAFAPNLSILPIDALGFSVTRLETGGIEGADASGNLSGSNYGSGDTALALSGSGSLFSGLHFGLTAKMIQSQIAGYSSKMTPAGDMGITYIQTILRQPVSFGASITNFGSGIRFVQQNDPLPTAANLGAALPLGPATMVFEVNRLINQQQTQFGIGFEYGLGPVSFRSGYIAQNQSGNLALQDSGGLAERIFASGLTAGVGIKMGSTRLDYALSNQAVDFGMTQRIALSVQWGSEVSRSRTSSSTEKWQPSPEMSDWIMRSLGDGN